MSPVLPKLCQPEFTERMGGAPGRPMTISFPESEYLKGLVVMRKP